MAVQIEAYRTPDELAADLVELSRVDWGLVWPGRSGADAQRWSAQFGWRLEQIDRMEDLVVRLRSGGTLDVLHDRKVPYPHPVKWVGLDVWSATAQTVADNAGLFVSADHEWPRYLAAGSRAIGEPGISTAWDDPEFPDSSRWPDREDRLRQRRPYRLAGWLVSGAIMELDVSPSGSAAANSYPGRILLSLAVRPSQARP